MRTETDTRARPLAKFLPAALAVGILLALLGAVAVGLAHRGGLFSGVGQAFRAAALPAICALLLLHGVLALGTARQEGAMNDALTQISQHEGRDMACLVGQN